MGTVDIYPSSVLQLPPSAQIGYAEVTAGQTGISAAANLTGLSVTVTVPAGRRLRITGHGQIANDATAGSALGEIMEGGTTLGRWCRNDVPASATTFSDEGGIIVSPTAGTHTYNLRLSKNVGGGVIDFQATANNPGFILVEDITGGFLNSSLVTSRVLRTVIDGGGSVITTGAKKVYMSVPTASTITKVRLLADVSGSIVLDLWKDTFANYPPTVADTIVAAAKPTLSSSIKSEDTTLTGWTTSLNAGDIIEVNVDSVSTVTKVYLDLFLV